MELSHRNDKGTYFLLMKGDMSFNGIPEMKEYVEPLLADETLKILVFNLKQVHFIDSSGMGFILSLFKALNKRKAKLMLCHVNEKNHELFKMTHLDRYLTIISTEADVLQS